MNLKANSCINLFYKKLTFMPKCKNCKRSFEAYSIESAKLPVVDQKPLEVMKLTCPLCGATHHMLPSLYNEVHIKQQHESRGNMHMKGGLGVFA